MGDHAGILDAVVLSFLPFFCPRVGRPSGPQGQPSEPWSLLVPPGMLWGHSAGLPGAPGASGHGPAALAAPPDCPPCAAHLAPRDPAAPAHLPGPPSCPLSPPCTSPWPPRLVQSTPGLPLRPALAGAREGQEHPHPHKKLQGPWPHPHRVPALPCPWRALFGCVQAKKRAPEKNPKNRAFLTRARRGQNHPSLCQCYPQEGTPPEQREPRKVTDGSKGPKQPLRCSSGPE